MKYNIIKSIFAVASLAALVASCSEIDKALPQGGTMLASQLEQATTAAPQRADATYTGMFTKLGDPLSYGRFSSSRPDDFGFIMMAFSNDLEAADIVMANNDYNWFSTCGELTSRNADYANPYIRYRACYDEIGRTNDMIKAFVIDEDTSDDIKSKVGQAYVLRAFSYLNLAPYYQFSYAVAADKPCVPIVTEDTEDFTNNPRATVAEVYEQILNDLAKGIDLIGDYARTDKSKIDKQVAYALRARTYLYMGKYAEAAEDADIAIGDTEPATIEEVSKPSFYSISESNWIWGYDMTTDVAQTFPYATITSWISPFTANGYAVATGSMPRINVLLYDKIPESDVRKGWWVNEDLYSPLLEGLKWDDLEGQEIASKEIPDVKLIFDPYTNVKFGANTIGTILNDEDWPFIRVEEMILTKAEGLIKSGKQAEGIAVLNDFVKTYRDPEYNAQTTGRTIEDEIWFQRRVELWGEGFANADTRRLQKPLVRFHKDKNNYPDAFRFNMTADDGWWLLRFCTDELNTNKGIIDNTDGKQPVIGQNAELRDGVTD